MKNKSCPSCSSENVEPDMSGRTVFSHGNITDWTCNECGYSGPMPEEFEEDEDEERQGLMSSYLEEIRKLLPFL